MLPRLLAALLALALLPALAEPVHADGASPHAPSFVTAQDSGGLALVSWSPGEEAADFYRVYGLDGAALVPLDSADGFSARVPGGYAGYAVAGVKVGAESPPVRACIVIDPTGPAIGLVPPCDALPLDVPP